MIKYYRCLSHMNEAIPGADCLSYTERTWKTIFYVFFKPVTYPQAICWFMPRYLYCP